MTTGTNISLAAHGALIFFVLFGGIFSSSQAPPVRVADVSVITEAELQALTPPAQAPELATEAPTPTLPEELDAPEVPEADTAPERPEVSVAEAPEPPPLAPNIPETPDALETNVLDSAPVLDLVQDGAELVPVIPDGAPAPAPRVAPEAAPAPPPDVAIGPDALPDISTDAPELAEVEEESEAQAPEEATTDLVTEADEQLELAPERSQRPRSRPAPQTQVTEATEDTPEDPVEPLMSVDPEAARDAAVAAVATGQTSAQPAQRVRGTPMTAAEEDAFRLSVQRCWVVDIGSEAAEVEVVWAFELDPDGKVINGSMRQVRASDGSDAAVRAAYEAARRAILRCGASGFDLPAEKYEQWREVEITFSIEEMGR
ncbi:MAG: energy transducer TonB [Rhodobacteraceae bacterium]|nr:energy transducer TonB [Paracoccaceae bacterium]